MWHVDRIYDWFKFAFCVSGHTVAQPCGLHRVGTSSSDFGVLWFRRKHDLCNNFQETSDFFPRTLLSYVKTCTTNHYQANPSYINNPADRKLRRCFGLFFCQSAFRSSEIVISEDQKTQKMDGDFGVIFFRNVCLAIAKCKFWHVLEFIFASCFPNFETWASWLFPSPHFCGEECSATATFSVQKEIFVLSIQDLCKSREDVSSVASKIYESLEKMSAA